MHHSIWIKCFIFFYQDHSICPVNHQEILVLMWSMIVLFVYHFIFLLYCLNLFVITLLFLLFKYLKRQNNTRGILDPITTLPLNVQKHTNVFYPRMARNPRSSFVRNETKRIVHASCHVEGLSDTRFSRLFLPPADFSRPIDGKRTRKRVAAGPIELKQRGARG